MLRFRRSEKAKTPRVDPTARAQPAGPIDKAEALIALLGDDARKMGMSGKANALGTSAIPPDRLRDMAKHLIAQIEAKPTAPVPGPPSEHARQTPSPAPTGRLRKVFSQPTPLVATASPDIAKTVAESGSGNAASAVPRPVPPRRAPETMPEPIAPTFAATTQAVTLALKDVQRIVEEGVSPGAVGREHPAIVAMTLSGRPPLEQAAALRQLPRGQVRSVHRALRLLETRQG